MFPPEEYFGNIEYKRSILHKNNKRLEELATQMNFRLNEGNGKATYYIGVEDNGKILFQSDKVLEESLNNFKKICKIIKAVIISIEKQVLCMYVYRTIYALYLVQDKSMLLFLLYN